MGGPGIEFEARSVGSGRSGRIFWQAGQAWDRHFTRGPGPLPSLHVRTILIVVPEHIQRYGSKLKDWVTFGDPNSFGNSAVM